MSTPPTSPVSRSILATANAPAAIGPYSQAVRCGQLLFVSGQIPLDPATGQVIPGGITEQTTRVLENLRAIAEAAGTSLAHALKATVFLTDFNHFAAMNAIYGQFFAPDGTQPPARTTVEVSRLPKDVLIEIDLVVAIP